MFLPLFLSLALTIDWTPLGKTLLESVVLIESSDGVCTGWVLNANAKGDKDLIATAAHCDGEHLYADGASARIIAKDVKKDLMVLEIEDTGKPALKLAKENPKIGEEVASLGFGWGLERPMFRIAHVSDDNTYIPEDNIGGPFIMIDAQFVPGMSGGPIINAKGEVVMIVQRSGGGVGIGVGARVISDKIGRYVEKVKP